MNLLPLQRTHRRCDGDAGGRGLWNLDWEEMKEGERGRSRKFSLNITWFARVYNSSMQMYKFEFRLLSQQNI